MFDPPFNPAGLSRVILEPVLCRAIRLGEHETAEAIRAELAARTWQHVNPYAEPLPPSP